MYYLRLNQATLLARAGYDAGNRSGLSPEGLNVLLLFTAVPSERRRGGTSDADGI